MSIKIDIKQARRVLEEAIVRAQGARQPSTEWVERIRQVRSAPSKTYTPALGTALLARATHDQIDPLALKVTDHPRSYSARTLAEKVLVPIAVEVGIDLVTTSRQPLNNQPFFRYDRIDEMPRVHGGARAAHKELVETLRYVDLIDEDEAMDALTSFVWVGLEAASAAREAALDAVRLDTARLIAATETFVVDDPEDGKRGQALVAATFDLVSPNVRAGRVYDPSRRFPGDVQILEGPLVLLAVEARQKPVQLADTLHFADRLRRAGTAHGLVVALDPAQDPLPRAHVQRICAERHGVTMSIVEGVRDLMTGALVWSARPIHVLLEEFPERMLRRLEEVEASPDAIKRWLDLFRSSKRRSP